MWFFHNPGLLGLNARNLLYIRAYNPKKAILMADDKLKTKNFLSARGVPVAKLYALVKSKKELKTFDWNSLPESFAVKPNSGYGGEGILIFKGRKGINWIKEDGTVMEHDSFVGHINDILDGRYSLSNTSDIALFEQKLEAPELLKKMSYRGLPDIRVVVHNLIPVMAMLRLSTEKSGGKSNIHQGGIGVGIDLAKGELTHVTLGGKKVDAIPGFGDVQGIKIPHWEEILLIASRVQQITNLGFAAVDIALDKNVGPVLLEINARSGLGVQIANMAPLRLRLQRIEGIKVSTPEKGVRIAQDIFGQKIETKESKNLKTVVGLMERVELISGKHTRKLIAQMNPSEEKTFLDRDIAAELHLEEGKVKLILGNEKLTTFVELADFKDQKYKLLIGRRDLRDFFIDSAKYAVPSTMTPEGVDEKMATSVPYLVHQFTEEEVHELDQELYEIDKEIHLLKHLRPINMEEEEKKFLQNITYNPQFEYCDLEFDANHLHARLKRLEFPESPIGILLRKKADEITRKIDLLESRGTSRFTSKSIYLFDAPDEALLKEAIEEIKRMPAEFPKSGKRLSSKEAQKLFEQALSDFGLKGWRVILKEHLVSDVIAGKEKKIMIRAGASFYEARLKGTIAHEIETHVFTAMNGSLQPYKIFQRGLAGYLMTEEGLAVYNQEKTESIETEKKYWPASSVIGIQTAMQGSFADVVETLLKYGFNTERALRVALKTKRGLTDTSQPGAFTKDFVYFKGHRMILEFLASGGDLKELYYGKLNLKDLDTVKKVKGLKEPLYLPSHLRKSSS